MEKTLGEKLKEYRERKFPGMGLRKAEDEIKKTSDDIKINFVHLNRLENGLSPSVETIKKLSKIYELSSTEEIELYTLAKKMPPEITDYFRDNPNEVEKFFRTKIKK